MSGVVKIASMVDSMAGEGAAAMTVTLAAYMTAIVVPTERHQVSINNSRACGRGFDILMFAGSHIWPLTTFSGWAIRIYFEHGFLISKWHIRCGRVSLVVVVLLLLFTLLKGFDHFLFRKYRLSWFW